MPKTLTKISDVRYPWIDGFDGDPKDWDRIESILAAKGWMSLNPPTSRILVAEDAKGELLGFHVFQMLPYCGPLYVRPSARGTGLAEDLADKMLDFLIEVKARGWLVTAESPHAEKLCIEHGMKRVDSPVYMMTFAGGVET
jgi:hypothetical protein